ncbi:hypothetical protein ACRALDRAFT_2018324 [Sodiomyces alcalophilus JCM 7366]|uniref:uncharacterized protein n=1 Tax=Sodiomyces alcalophilus JCM 7366 TaxID=591952 RepID=UPI0039B39455
MAGRTAGKPGDTPRGNMKRPGSYRAGNTLLSVATGFHELRVVIGNPGITQSPAVPSKFLIRGDGMPIQYLGSVPGHADCRSLSHLPGNVLRSDGASAEFYRGGQEVVNVKMLVIMYPCPHFGPIGLHGRRPELDPHVRTVYVNLPELSTRPLRSGRQEMAFLFVCIRVTTKAHIESPL